MWLAVRESASTSRYLVAMLTDLALDQLTAGNATLSGPASIVAAAQSKTSDLEQLFERVTGRPVRIALRAHEPPPAEQQPARAPAADHPLVRQAVEQLGARIVAIHPRSKSP